jgi:hypothetical protein
VEAFKDEKRMSSGVVVILIERFIFYFKVMKKMLIFEEFALEKERTKTEGILKQFGLEKRISGFYEKDFSLNPVNIVTCRRYPYFSNVLKTESLEWVFYKGENRLGVNQVFVFGEYYQSGMKHDIVVLHKDNDTSRELFQHEGTQNFLYQDEILKNQASILRTGELAIENPSYFSHIIADADNSCIIRNIGSILNHKSEIALDTPVDIERTTFMFYRILSQPIITDINIRPSQNEIILYAKTIWDALANPKTFFQNT